MSILRDCPNTTPSRLADELPPPMVSRASDTGATTRAQRVPSGDRGIPPTIAAALGFEPESDNGSAASASARSPDDASDDTQLASALADLSVSSKGDADATDAVRDKDGGGGAAAVGAHPASDTGAGSAEEGMIANGNGRRTPATDVMNPLPPPMSPDDYGPITEVFISVYNANVGRIIGKKGQTITDIQDRSGAVVEIPQQCEPGTHFRKIVIRGTIEQIQYCSVLLRLHLPTQNPEEIAALQYEVQQLQEHHSLSSSLTLRVVEVPMEHVGRVIGRKGAYLRQLKKDTGATVTLPRFSLHGSPHQIFTIMGSSDEVDACESVLREKIEQCRTTASPPGHPVVRGPRVSSPSTLHRNFAYVASPEIRDVLFVRVPNEHVGRVIGKGGAAIKELQRQTGARIHLPGEIDGQNWRQMQIHGLPLQRDRCYAMLIAKVPFLEAEESFLGPDPRGPHAMMDPRGGSRGSGGGGHGAWVGGMVPSPMHPHMFHAHHQHHQPHAVIFDEMGYPVSPVPNGYMMFSPQHPVFADSSAGMHVVQDPTGMQLVQDAGGMHMMHVPMYGAPPPPYQQSPMAGGQAPVPVMTPRGSYEYEWGAGGPGGPVPMQHVHHSHSFDDGSSGDERSVSLDWGAVMTTQWPQQ